MNPITNIKNLNKINERELKSGTAGDDRRSWHAKYKDSAWVFVGGLPYDLSEGDVVCIFSQYGEIVNINLIRDKKTGKSRGFAFICYEDQRSTILAVDNFNGAKVLGRMLRVDHVEKYRVPKERDDVDEETKLLWMEGCAPDVVEKSQKTNEVGEKIKSEEKEKEIETRKDREKSYDSEKRRDEKRKKRETSNDSGKPRDEKRRGRESEKKRYSEKRKDKEEKRRHEKRRRSK